MKWQTILGDMVVKPEAETWATISTGSGWNACFLLALVFLLFSFMSLIHVTLGTRQQHSGFWGSLRFHILGWSLLVVGFLALVFWKTSIWDYVQDPTKLLENVTSNSATSHWALSPNGVSWLLQHLKTLGVLHLTTVTTVLIAILAPIVLLFPGVRKHIYQTDDYESRARTLPNEGERATLAVDLRFDYAEPTIKGILFEGEWRPGSARTVYASTLYIDPEPFIDLETEDRWCKATIDREEVRDSGKDWVPLHLHVEEECVLTGRLAKDRPRKNGEPNLGYENGQEVDVKPGNNFWVRNNLRFRFLGSAKSDKDNVSSTHTGIYSATSAIIVGLTLFATFLSTAEAWTKWNGPSSGFSTSTGPCLAPITDTIGLSRRDGAEWSVVGDFKILDSRVKDDSLLTLEWWNPPERRWQELKDAQFSRRPPLLVKFLFDLDPLAIYDPIENPLWLDNSSDGDIKQKEKEFWDGLIEGLLEPLKLTGVNVPNESDKAIVFATYPCHGWEARQPFYTPDTKEKKGEPDRLAVSITKDGVRNRVLRIVDCAYQLWPSNTKVETNDISSDVYGLDHIDIFADKGYEKVLIILRWRQESTPIEYKAFSEKAGRVILLVISRSDEQTPSSPQSAAQQTVVNIRAPARYESGPGEDPEKWREILREVYTRIGEARYMVGFSVRFPYLLDRETFDQARIRVVYNKGATAECSSKEASLELPKKSEMETDRSQFPVDVMMFIYVLLFLALFQVCLVGALLGPRFFPPVAAKLRSITGIGRGSEVQEHERVDKG